MGLHPEIVWAQRTDKVFLTVELPDSKDTKVNVTPEGKFTYTSKAGADDACYEVELELFDKINVHDSKFSFGLRHTFCVLVKEEKQWWKRLLKPEGKPPPYVKVDWNRWVDEDEEDEKPDGMGNFDLSSMNDFSNFDFGGAGPPGGDEDEEDEEEVANPASAEPAEPAEPAEHAEHAQPVEAAEK